MEEQEMPTPAETRKAEEMMTPLQAAMTKARYEVMSHEQDLTAAGVSKQQVKDASANENELVSEKPSTKDQFPQTSDEYKKEENLEQEDMGITRLEITGLPTDIVIEDFQQDPRPLQFNDFKFLIRQSRWDLACRESGGRLYVDIKPKAFESVVEQDGLFIDTAIAQKSKGGEIELKPDTGYTTTLPLGYQEGMIHRGVYSGEMRYIVENGRISTRGDAVKNIGGHEGLTFFTSLPDLAQGYAAKAGRVQGAYYPSFDQPNYIVTVKKPADVAFEGDSGEVGILQELPLSDIESVIEVRPYAIKQGVIPLESNNGRARPAQGVEAYQNPMQMEVAFRVVSVNQLKSHFHTENVV